MIKKSFTNNKYEICDLLFKEDSKIVTYLYQAEESVDYESQGLKNLFLDLCSGINYSINGLVEEPRLSILTYQQKNDLYLIIVEWDPELRQVNIYKYKNIKDIVCENIFVSEIDLENRWVCKEKIAPYFFVYFFSGDFYHIVSLFDDNVEILQDGKNHSGKRSAIMILKSLRLSMHMRESNGFNINRIADNYVFQFGSQMIRIQSNGDCIKKIFLEERRISS